MSDDRSPEVQILELERKVKVLTERNNLLDLQAQNNRDELKGCKDHLQEWNNRWDKAVARFKAEEEKYRAEVEHHRRLRAEEVQKAKQDAMQDRANLITECDSLKDKLAQTMSMLDASVQMRDGESRQYLETIGYLKGSLAEAERVLPCGHHHSNDDHAGGCRLCR